MVRTGSKWAMASPEKTTSCVFPCARTIALVGAPFPSVVPTTRRPLISWGRSQVNTSVGFSSASSDIHTVEDTVVEEPARDARVRPVDRRGADLLGVDGLEAQCRGPGAPGDHPPRDVEAPAGGAQDPPDTRWLFAAADPARVAVGDVHSRATGSGAGLPVSRKDPSAGTRSGTAKPLRTTRSSTLMSRIATAARWAAPLTAETRTLTRSTVTGGNLAMAVAPDGLTCTRRVTSPAVTSSSRTGKSARSSVTASTRTSWTARRRSKRISIHCWRGSVAGELSQRVSRSPSTAENGPVCGMTAP